MTDYTQVYPDISRDETESIDGYVQVHHTHTGEERTKNIETAIFLAKLGYKIKLLEVLNIQGHKTLMLIWFKRI